MSKSGNDSANNDSTNNDSTNNDRTNNDRTNNDSNPSLLNNSIVHLTQYRKLQAKRLRIRLNIFTKVVLDLFKSIDNIKGNGCHAVESQQDIDIINRMIEL